jgi:cytosine/adenosine deaminase-related metal-dependent hydrolase
MHIYAASCLLPINGSTVEGGAIAVENGLILAVGKLKDLRKRFTAPLLEFPDAVIMPGLVNAHTHLELTHFPAWLAMSGLDTTCCSYVDWIIRVIKVKRQTALDALSRSLLEGIKMSLQSGTTMVGDILSERRLIPAYKNSKLSGRVFLEFLGQDQSRSAQLLDTLDQDISSIPENFLPGISPHSPFTISQALLRALLDAARSRMIPLTMHLSESKDESTFFRASTGRIAEDLYPFIGWEEFLPEPMGITPTQWLDYSNALEPDFLAVHGVNLSKSDIAMIKDRGASVVLAPRSNHNLDVGKTPVREMLQAGIPLSLGTDSLASCDSLSLWDEMRFLLDAFPESFSPSDAIKMATIGGARAIKRDREAGTLEPGKRADFIVMEIGTKLASGKVCEQLIEGARVQGVWCSGKNALSSVTDLQG